MEFYVNLGNFPIIEITVVYQFEFPPKINFAEANFNSYCF